MANRLGRRQRQTVPDRWNVTLTEHSLASGRWLIPGWTGDLVAVDEEDARTFAVQLAHARAQCPPWRPLRRESLMYCKAEPGSDQRAEVGEVIELFPRVPADERRAA